MFKKILVANRGEIACRIMETAKRMGIATVAVYSDADKDGLHVEMADEAVPIGPAEASRSYLVIENIIEACRTSGAQAVHPGYGFLSENPAFADALEAAGIVLIGPPASAMKSMGDKIESKRIAKSAGVNVVPGGEGIVESQDAAVAAASTIGYPVMIKASAGGGGKGMRFAADEAEVREGFNRAKSEAQSAFGDDRIFVEKFIQKPRHIEIQILSDALGNRIYLNERECSIQRRNQKIVEEAPSSFLDADTRAAMGGQAVALAKAVNYCSAGTVEFIVDQGRNFYFLEMNTRLQVEHPVTELITGIDLVEHMIRIAAGERLSISQEDVTIEGWALECRIYAEDPFRDFVPSTGRLTRYRRPFRDCDGIVVREDTGVYEGATISPYYDPMISKLCVHAKQQGLAGRNDAVNAMADALDRFTIDGVQTNIPFLSMIMADPDWRSGNISTAYVQEKYPQGFPGTADREGEWDLIAVAAAVELVERGRLDRHIGRLAPHPGQMPKTWSLVLDRNRQIRLEIIKGDPGVPCDIEIVLDGGKPKRICTDWRPGDLLWCGEVDGREVTARVRRSGIQVSIFLGDRHISCRLMTPYAGSLIDQMPEKAESDRSNFVKSPMPGLIVSLEVVEGQAVAAGDTLAVIEAMKMENVIKAERSGTVQSIRVAPGNPVGVDEPIMEIV